jgi:hypothetical protein
MTKTVTTLDSAPAKTSAPAPAATNPDAAILIKHNAQLSGKRMFLTIHASPGEGGHNAVFIGLNEVGYQVPRGKPWNVPSELVENLANATEIRYERDDDGVIQSLEVPRFAYTATAAPDAA